MSKFESSDSWMFLSVAYSAQDGPATLEDFYAAADHINCAIPTHDEIQGGINRLASAGLVDVQDDRFILTGSGRKIFERVSRQTLYPRTQPELVEQELRSVTLVSTAHSHWGLSAEVFDAALSRYNKRMKDALRKTRG
jgi:hypothetical protein